MMAFLCCEKTRKKFAGDVFKLPIMKLSISAYFWRTLAASMENRSRFDAD